MISFTRPSSCLIFAVKGRQRERKAWERKAWEQGYKQYTSVKNVAITKNALMVFCSGWEVGSGGGGGGISPPQSLLGGLGHCASVHYFFHSLFTPLCNLLYEKLTSFYSKYLVTRGPVAGSGLKCVRNVYQVGYQLQNANAGKLNCYQCFSM